jgi:endonuclease IV
MGDMLAEYTAAALKKDNYREKIEPARQFCEPQGWVFGVQIHNSTPQKQIEQLAAEGLPMSFHAPSFNCDYFMNLANQDFGFARDSLRKTTEVMAGYKATTAVFHGFLMTNEPVLCFNATRGYEECMSAARRVDLSRGGTPLCGDFFNTEEYRTRFERVRERLAEVNRTFDSVTWCIENDFPAYSAGVLFAEQMLALESPLCLDVSHLWASCVLFGRDFLGEVEAVAGSGRVRCVHLHANPLRMGAPIEQINDGHRRLSTENQMNLPETARILYRGGVRHWVIETPQADLPDLQLLAEWLEKANGKEVKRVESRA